MNPEIDEEGNKRWKNEEGYLHRLNGPALELANGVKAWYKNGKLHRKNEDGPAVEWPNGDTAWYRDGVLHRENGPAKEGEVKQWRIKGDFIIHKKLKDYFPIEILIKYGELTPIEIAKYRLTK